VFATADKMEQGAAPNWRKVASTFQTAYLVMDACTQFDACPPKVNEMNTYAKARCVAILKALKAGETPVPAPQPEDDNEGIDLDEMFPDPSVPSATSQFPPPQQFQHQPSPAYGAVPGYQQPPQQPSYQQPPQQPSFQQPPQQYQSPQSYQQPQYTPTAQPYAQPSAPEPRRSNRHKTNSLPLQNAVVHFQCTPPGQKDKLDAVLAGERLIKHALTAVRFDDVATACQKLQEAMAIMYPFKDVHDVDSDSD
jgi:hypothetical protein